MQSLLFLALLASAASDTRTATYRTACAPAAYEAWSIQFEADGSSKAGHDRSNLYCYYDGRADMSEYRGLDKSNQPYYHGVSVTIWNDDRSIGRSLWAMVGTDGYTDIELRWDGDKLVSETEGREPQGTFLGRTTSEFHPGGDFKFVMERSYDGGETWISPRNTIEYLKTPTPPPALPENWAPQLSYADQFVGEGGMIILDGFAWGRFVENQDGAPVGFTFASVAPKGDGWVWRTLNWTFEDGVADISDIPLGSPE